MFSIEVLKQNRVRKFWDESFGGKWLQSSCPKIYLIKLVFLIFMSDLFCLMSLFWFNTLPQNNLAKYFETMILMMLYNDDVNCLCQQRLPSSPSHSASSGGSSRGSWTLRRLMESPPPQLLGECRPRSCVDSVSGSADLAATARKRWSVNLGGKLIQAYDRLGDDTEEEYTDRYSLLLC